MLKFRCTTCDQKIGVPDDWANHLVRCPRCKNAIPVPTVVEVEVKRVPIFAEPPKTPAPPAPPLSPPPPKPESKPAPRAHAAVATKSQVTKREAPPKPAAADAVITKVPVPTDVGVFAMPPVNEPEAKPQPPALPDQTIPITPAPSASVEAVPISPAPPPDEPTPEPPEVKKPADRPIADSLRLAIEPGITSPTAVADLLKSLESTSAEAPKEQAAAPPKVDKPKPRPNRPPANYQARTLGAIGILAGVAGLSLNVFPVWTKFSLPVAILGVMTAVLATLGRPTRRTGEIAVAVAAFVVSALAAVLALLASAGVLPGGAPIHAIAQRATPLLAEHKGDVEVRVKSVSVVRPVVYESGHWKTSDKPQPFLQIDLELRELRPSGRVAYRSWGRLQDGVDPPALIDNEGNPLKLQDFTPAVPVGRPRVSTAYLDGVHHGISDVLHFEAPPAAAQMLDLQLPASNFGADGVVEFHIPSAMLRR